MSAVAQAVAGAALAAVGTRFRLHGRDVEHGLDCVGLVALALRGGGYVGAVPTGYRLRGGNLRDVAGVLDVGLARGDGVGAVIACRTGPGQLHLAVRVADGIVHADAGLGRVVTRPGDPPWPVLAAWRLREE